MRLRLAKKGPAAGCDGEKGAAGDRGRDGMSIVGLPGKQGPSGGIGEPGDSGLDGWAPIMAVIPDGERRVLKVTDWAGGEGEKPEAGWFLGPAGPVGQASQATDIRGEAGKRGELGAVVGLKEIYVEVPQSLPSFTALFFEPIMIENETVYRMSVNVP